jgi:hypothetical protein
MIGILTKASIGQPLTREGVSLFPVYIHQGSVRVGLADPDTLKVSELPDAEVPTLVATNDADVPVLLPAGWIVEGGRQNRVVNVPVLVPEHATIEIPVSCVEQGRWNGARNFGYGRSVAPRRVRRENARSVADNIRYTGMKRADQGRIWSTVAGHLDDLGVQDYAHNLLAAEEALFDDRRGAIVEDIVTRGPLPGQNGVVVTHGSRVVNMDIFANQELLAQAWESLVRGYFSELAHSTGRPSASKVLTFVKQFAQAEAVEIAGTGAGTELHVTHPKVTGQILAAGDALIYASCFAEAA